MNCAYGGNRAVFTQEMEDKINTVNLMDYKKKLIINYIKEGN